MLCKRIEPRWRPFSHTVWQKSFAIRLHVIYILYRSNSLRLVSRHVDKAVMNSATLASPSFVAYFTSHSFRAVRWVDSATWWTINTLNFLYLSMKRLRLGIEILLKQTLVNLRPSSWSAALFKLSKSISASSFLRRAPMLNCFKFFCPIKRLPRSTELPPKSLLPIPSIPLF